VLGALCVSLYAWFDYRLMWNKHWEHHNQCGEPHADPDFHKGARQLYCAVLCCSVQVHSAAMQCNASADGHIHGDSNAVRRCDPALVIGSMTE
jgi:hypothetical protein